MSAGIDGIRAAEAVAASLTGSAPPESMIRGETRSGGNGAGVYG
jgi:hypothetical protein